MEARLRSWWQQIKRPFPVIGVIAAGILLIILVIGIIGGYLFNWKGTGVGQKTLWDWMQLLFIPVVLAIAGFWFSHREREAAEERAENDQKAAELRAKAARDIEQQRAIAEQEIASDNQQEAALQEYIDKMSDLLLRENLSKSESKSEVRKIARVRTLTVLSRLNSWRKRTILQFLYEADLINKNNPIVDLQGADFTETIMNGIDLHEAMLSKIDLRGTRLWDANLSEVDLSNALLDICYKALSVDKAGEVTDVEPIRTFISNTNLSGAILRNTNLSDSWFSRTNLSKAILDGANLSNAVLSGSDLKGAIVTPEQLAQVKSLKGATLPDGTIHP